MPGAQVLDRVLVSDEFFEARVEVVGVKEKVVRALKGLLPAVDIISMNIRDFEKATYCNATMIEIGDASV